ncbi:MAG TPA: RnfABCDGE type electron transport complex subunit B [Clostridia bacterium]|nr:RnfABCDGE type electron transport complex subunit B [Clostridia bacterium]
MLLFFREINWSSVGLTVAIMFAVALLFGIIIMVISKFTAVKGTDPRIAEIKAKLGGANCGACGKAGCEDFAKALCEGTATLEQCGQTSKESKVAISNILGINYTSGGDTRIVVMCSGGINCKDKFEYQGYGDCVSQQMLADGRKACLSGCMGSGTCVNVCPVQAIDIYDGLSHILDKVCIGCGSCVNACPKNIIHRIPKEAKIYVACSNHCKGREVVEMCSTGCIGCGLCEKKCPENAIHMENNTPVIDYSKCSGCMTCVAVCPKKVIKPLEKL